MKLQMRESKMSTCDVKKTFLERLPRVPEQLSEVWFPSQDPGASPCHPHERKSELKEGCHSSDHRAYSVPVTPTVNSWISVLGPKEGK